MPRDDWAKAKAADFGGKAKASGEFFTREPAKPKRTRRKKAKKTPCVKCGSHSESMSSQRFKDGSSHVRVNCAECGKYKRWAKL